MKQINVPPLLQNLPAAKQYQQKRPKSQGGNVNLSVKSAESQGKRSISSVSFNEPVSGRTDVPAALGNLQRTALEVGLAMKYIPVQFSRDEKIFQAADEVDHVIDAITDHRTDVVDGTGLTEMWNDVRCNSLVWVSCDILKKLDENKFLVFISENAEQKVVSTENLIFENVILLTETDNRDPDGNYELKRDIIEVKHILQPFFDRDMQTDDFINIFEQQKSNFKMRQRFEEAICRFGELSISMTKEQFEEYDDYTEFAVVNMHNTRLHDLFIPSNTTSAERVLLLRNEVQSRLNQSYRVPLNKQEIVLDKIISESVSLCTGSINSIDFAKINHQDGIFDFEEVQNEICEEFIQEAQLVDSELLILRQAKRNPEHELNWCAEFLSVFLWSRFKIFQTRNLFYYCFEIDQPDESNLEVFEVHKRRFHEAEIIVSRHLQNIYSKTFMALRRYIEVTFEQHSEYIMASATKLISMIWTHELPAISNKVSESFIQHFSHKGINEFFLQVKAKGNLKNLSFRQSFSEKLINTHKVVYQILTPHFVDEIMSDFAYEVLEELNSKMHKYQAQHGKTPSLKLRDEFAEESYRITHNKYVEIFKIMQITFLKIFVDELYENALPQWFYFLLALVHGGKKKQSIPIEQKADITRFLHTTPNDEGFYSSLEKDIDSLNKFTDFKILYKKSIGKRVLRTLSGLEFALLPVFHDNFVSGVEFTPDPLEMAKRLEECVEDLHMYYSSSPKFSDILIFDVTTSEIKNRLTLHERELMLDKSDLSYKQYLNIAYSDMTLAGGSEGNPFKLGFLQADGKPKASKAAGKFITLTNSGFKLHEAVEEEFEFDIKIETRLAEAVYYEPSILLQKLVRLSKMAGEKLYRYFDELKKYFCNHIQDILIEIERIFAIDDLLPPEVTKLDAYCEILGSIQQNTKMLKIQGTNEEQIRLRMKPISDFLHTEQLILLVSDEFRCGCAPPLFIKHLLEHEIASTVDTLRAIFKGMYSILALPNMCYYSTFKINLSQLLSALEVQDKLLFDSYSQRLEDYFCLAVNVISACLCKIHEKLGETTFASAAEIGEIYEVCKLFGGNKDAWIGSYKELERIIEQYEQLPLGVLSSQHYNAMSAALYKSKALFKKVFNGQAQVVVRVGDAYEQAFSFVQNVQFGFDSLIAEIFQRVQEYFSISYQDWVGCTDNEAIFKQKYPFLTASIRFPKPIKIEEYGLIDVKRLVREVEQVSQMPVFKANHIKIHVFERFEQFKQDNLNDAFQELDDIITRSIDTLKLLLELKLELLGNTEIEHFDSIDKLLFGSVQKKEYYIQQLRNQGELLDFSQETMREIVSSSENTANPLSRLLNLQPVFQIAYKLVSICSTLPTSYSQWLDESLALIHLDDMRRELIDAIRISTLVMHKFDPQYEIVTLARNLLLFLEQNNTAFRLIFMSKTAVYENSFQTLERERNPPERIPRSEIDQLVKMDACDFAVNSGVVNSVIESVNFKISDDVRAHELIGVLQSYVEFIFKYSSVGAKRARFERLLQMQEQEINRMFMAEDQRFAIEPHFELYALEKREKPKIQLNFEEYGSVGADVEKIREHYKCFYCRSPHDEQIFAENALENQKSGFFEEKKQNELFAYLNEQKNIILEARFLDAINAFEAQALLNETDSLLQLVQLHWHVFVYCERIAFLDLVADETSNSNFLVRKLDSNENERFQEILKQFKSLLTGCYTTASNAYQLAQRKFVKDKLWDHTHELYSLMMRLIKVKAPYFVHRKHQNHEFLASVFVDLLWCDTYYTPVLDSSGPLYNGALIYLLPDEINNSLMSILASLGIECAGLNILYFMFKTPDGRSYNYYYVDGFTFIQNVYFKFVYPLVFQTERDIFLHLTAERLKAVVLATIEFHMLYWHERFEKDQQLPMQEILQFYPPAISFSILSQLIMEEIQQLLSLGGKHDVALERLSAWEKQMQNMLKECDIYAGDSMSDLTSMEEASAESMFISLENSFFHAPISEFDVYAPAARFSGIPAYRPQFTNATLPSEDSQSAMAINFENLDVLDALATGGQDDDSEPSIELVADNNSEVCDGWSPESFAMLALSSPADNFKEEEIAIMHYFGLVLEQFLASCKSNSYFSDFCLQYCSGNYELYIYSLKKYVAELRRDIFEGKRYFKEFEFKSHIEVFNDGGFMLPLKGNLKTYCYYSGQLNMASELELGHYIPRLVRAVALHECILCATPNIDRYYYPQLYCLLIDTVELLLQHHVLQFNITQESELDNLQEMIVNGDIIIVSGIDTCGSDALNRFKELCREAERLGTCIIIVMPCLFVNEVGESSIEESGLSIIRGLDLRHEQVIRLDELFASSMQQDYEELVVSLSESPPEMELSEYVVSIVLRSNTISTPEKITKLCYLIAEQNKFNQEITFTIASLIMQCFPGVLPLSLTFEEFARQAMSSDEFLYKLFEVCDTYRFGADGEEVPKKEIISFIPEQLTSFVYMSKEFIDECMINSEGWKYVADIILLLFSASVEELGVFVGSEEKLQAMHLAEVVSSITLHCIEFSTKTVQGCDDFGFEYDNQISILPHTLYIILYAKNDYTNNFGYRQMVEEFLAQQKPLSTFILLITSDTTLLEKYAHARVEIGDNIIQNKALLKEVVAQFRFKNILTTDIEILSQSALTPTEFDYVFSKFSITIEERETECQLRDIFVAMCLDLLDLFCQVFQFNDTVVVRTFLAQFFILLELYGIAHTLQDMKSESVLMEHFEFNISDTFLTQLVFSSKGTADALGKLTSVLFLLAFAAGQIFCVTCREISAQDQRYLEEYYETCYSNVILNKSSQEEYAEQASETLQRLKHFSSGEYVDTISRILPLPFTQEESTKGVDFSNRFMVYLPQLSCMADVSFSELDDFRDQLLLFGSGFHINKLIVDIEAAKVSLPYRFAVHRNFEIKSELFLTDSSTKESRVKSFFKEFGELFEFSNDQETMIVFVLFCNLRYQVPVQLFSAYSMQIEDLIYGKATLFLHEWMRSYESVEALFQGREYSELRLLTYNIDVEDDIFSILKETRELLTLRNEQAIFNIYTIIKLCIANVVENSEVLSDLLKKCVELPNNVGESSYYTLCNCTFVVNVKNPSETHRPKNDKVEVLCCDQEPFDFYKFNTCALNELIARDILSDCEERDVALAIAARVHNANERFENEEIIGEYYEPHFKAILKLNLPFFSSLIGSLFVDARGWPSIFEYIAGCYNIGVYRIYYNRLLFGCIQDASRAEFKESFQESYEKHKNDPTSLYDFNDEIIEEASHFKYFCELAGLPLLQEAPPLHIIRLESLYSYKEILQAITIITDSIPDIPIDELKIRARNLLIDIGNACNVNRFLNLFYTQQFSALNTRNKVYACIRVAVTLALGLQKGQPYPEWARTLETSLAESSERQYSQQHNSKSTIQSFSTSPQCLNTAAHFLEFPTPFIPTVNNQTFHVLQPHQIENYDAFKYLNRKESYDQIIIVAPLSILLKYNLLHVFIGLSTPGNQSNLLFTSQELVDLCEEASIFSKFESVTPAVLEIVLSLKLQVFIIQDIQYDLNLLPNCADYINLMGFDAVLSPIALCNMRYNDVLKLNKNCSDRYTEEFEKRFAIKSLDEVVIPSDRKVYALVNYSYGKISRNADVVTVYSVIQTALHINELINKTEIEKKAVYREFQSRICTVLAVCTRETTELQHFQEQLRNEQLILQSLQETEASLAKINNDLETELNQIMKQLTIGIAKAQHMQQKIDALRKNQESLLLQNNFELEQVSKTEIIDLYNSNISNPTMIFVFQAIWYIIDGKSYENIQDMRYPEEEQIKELWRDIENEMFQRVAIPEELQSFDYQLLSPQKIEFIKDVCNLPEFKDQLLTFTETRLERKLVNYILALNNYFNNLIDEAEEFELKELKKSNEEFEKKRQYLKDEQEGTKIKIGNNQKMIDQCNMRVDEMKDQVNQQSNVVKAAESIQEFFLEQKNDIVFDIGECDSYINVSPYSAVIIAFVIFYGFDAIERLVGFLTPPKAVVCHYCQAYSQPVCQYCQQCLCLCTCLYDVDDEGNEVRSTKRAPLYQLTYPVNSKDNLISYLNGVNASYLAKRNAHELILGFSMDAMLELHSLLIFTQCYQNRCIAVSMRHFEKFICIAEQIESIPLSEIVVMGANNTLIHHNIADYALKDTTTYIVICITENAQGVEQLLRELVAYNSAVLEGGERVVSLGNQKVKITPELKCLRVYLVFSKKAHEIYLDDFTFENIILMSSAYLKNQVEMRLNEALVIEDEKIQSKLLQLNREQLDIILERYLRPSEMHEYTQAIFDVKQQEMQEIAHLNSIIEESKALKQESIAEQLALLLESINTLNNQEQTIKREKEFYEEEETKLVDVFRDKLSEHNQYYNAALKLMRLYCKLSKYYPVLVRIVGENAFIRTNSDEVIQNTVPYMRMLKNIISKLSCSLSLIDLEFIAFISVVYIEVQMEMINATAIQVIMQILEGKLTSQKKSFKEATQLFEPISPELQEINKWYIDYPADLNLMLEEEDPFAYVVMQNAKPTIPQFLKTRSAHNMLYLLGLVLFGQKRLDLERALSQFLHSTINYEFVFEGLNKLDNKQFFANISVLARQECVIVLVNNINRAIDDLFFLGQLNGITVIRHSEVESLEKGQDALHVMPIEGNDSWLINEMVSSGDKNLIFMIAKHPELMVLLQDFKIPVVDFDSCVVRNELDEAKARQAFAGVHISPYSTDIGQRALIMQGMAAFSEQYMLLYLAAEQLLMYSQQNANIACNAHSVILQLYGRFAFFSQAAKTDHECVAENLTTVDEFIEGLAKDSQHQLSQIMKHHDQTQYLELYNELPLQIEELLQLDLFKNIHSGILVKTAALIKELEHFKAGHLQQSILALEKQPIYSKNDSQIYNSVILLRILTHMTDIRAFADAKMSIEFNPCILHRSELTEYLHSLAKDARELAIPAHLSTSLTSSLSRNASNSSVKSGDHEEVNLKQVNLSEIFSSRENFSYHDEGAEEESMPAVLISQIIRNDEELACWGDKFVGVEISFQYAAGKYKYHCIIDIDGVLFNARSDFEPYGIVIRCME